MARTRLGADEVSSALAAVWPSVEPRLDRFLRGRGVDAATRQDIAQETFVRALAVGVPFDSADDLSAWVLKVGRNLAVSAHRKNSRAVLGLLPDQPSPTDIGRVVEARIRFETMCRLFRALPALDQRALVLPLVGYVPRSTREVNYWAVRRRRARARLTELVEQVSVAMILVRSRWRVEVEPLVPSVVAAVTALILSPGLAATAPPPRPDASVNQRPMPPAFTTETSVGDGPDFLNGLSPSKGTSGRSDGGIDLTGLDPSVARDRLRLDLSTVFLRLHPSMPPPGDDAWRS